MIHFCKKCGTLYTDSLGGCPKCNAEAVMQAEKEREAAEPAQEPADKNTVRRQWIAILIGVPALIGFLYLVIYLYTRFSAH